MSGERDRILGKLRGTPEEVAARLDESFEATKVDYLLRRFGLAKYRGWLLRRGEEATGRATLRLAVFHEAFPSFPAYLKADRLKGLRLHLDCRCFLPALLTDFRRAPFVRAYEDWYETAAESAGDRTVGLILNRHGLRHGLVVHSGGALVPRPPDCGLVYYGGTEDRPVLVYVRPFRRFVEGIFRGGHGWSPEGDLGRPPS
jgi:hypothetical protein